MTPISHFSVYQTSLTNVTEQLVRDAVADLAKQLNATVITNMESVYWEHERVLIGLKSNELPNGIGVRVENGQLVICGDSYGQQAGFARLQQMIPEYVKLYKVKQKAKATAGVKSTQIRVREKELELVVGY